MPPPPPTLPDELLEEVFLRLPPDEPASIVRACLASKLWLALLAGAAFHGRYRDFHGAAPMLGLFCRRPSPYWPSDSQEISTGPLFLSTTKFDARVPDAEYWRYHGCYALDCRHGRLLIGDNFPFPYVVTKVAVWDPMKGCWWNLGAPMMVESYGTAVLCAVTGCGPRYHFCDHGHWHLRD
ncbi:unnamed protein product [Alopecurus aequalis]